MQLKIQRSQRAGGVLGGTVYFCLDIRAEYSSEERDNIARYKLGGEVIYNSQTARKHLEQAGAHLDRTQSGNLGDRAMGLARGSLSMVMARISLNVTIASLGRGHHIECKDLEELLEAEDTLRSASKNLTRYLQAAATFDGSEVVIDYENGEEKVHITQRAPPLLEYQPDDGQVSKPADIVQGDVAYTSGREVKKLVDHVKDAFNEPGWSLGHRKVHIIIAAALLLILLYYLL